MPTRSERKKILLVEDHRLFRATLVQLINNEPGLMVCGEADNVPQALTLIEQTQPDAAIVDLQLGGPGGLDLLADLQARHDPLPVLVLSMRPATLYADRCLRAGANGFVSKSEAPANVLAALRQVLDGGTHFAVQ